MARPELKDRPGWSVARRATVLRRVGVALLLGAMVSFAILVVLGRTRLFVVLLALTVYLSARAGFRWILARHDRASWIPLAGQLAAGRLDEPLLVSTLPGLVHPALRTSAAVALAHLRADRGDWDGVRACLGRMGPASRAVIRRALDAAVQRDGTALALAERVMVWRVRLAGLTGSEIPSEVLFCAGAILHGRGLYRRAFSLGARAWQGRHDAITAYNCACALARSGDADAALQWLKRALEAGYPSSDLAQDGDFDALRSLPAFSTLAQPPPQPLH